LGVGFTGDRSQFAPISKFNSNITKISAQYQHGLALRNNTVIGWGINPVFKTKLIHIVW
jgi:hypothetical protein